MKHSPLFIRYLIAGFFAVLSPHQSVKATDSFQLTELYRYGEIYQEKASYFVGENSGIFLKVSFENQNRCLLLDKPGTYKTREFGEMLAQDAGKLEFFKCNLKALVLRLKTPAQMIIAPEPRGLVNTAEKESRFFEKTWEQLVLNKNNKIPTENLLAAAVWYYQKKKTARSAHILERAYKQSENPWILDLHHNAYASSSPDQIESEIKQTQNHIESAYSPESNLALLIGVQNYGKNSGWKSLHTPLQDIRNIKEILVEEYSFTRDNIQLLPDATYQQMLDAIEIMRKKVTNRTNLLIYYAGHGWIDEDGGYFWIPSDGEQSPKSWIYTEYILKKIKALNSLHTLFIVDSCFGGALNNHDSRGTIKEGTRQLYEKRSRQLITAGGLEPVADGGVGDNSVFASVFIDILKKQATDTPLSVHELFADLQPSVVQLSNQTPTYDRLPNSKDEWGQYYFIKKWAVSDTIADTEKETDQAPENKPTSLPAELMNDLNLTQPADTANNVTEIRVLRSESSVSLADLFEPESFAQWGGALSFKTKYKDKPLLLQLSYSTSQKDRDETISFQNQNYRLPQSIERLELKLGLRRINKKEQGQQYDESGVYYYWKRFRVEWDTSRVPNKKSNTEYVNIGYHALNFDFFKGWKINNFVDAGINYDFSLGLVSLSGSTTVARTEKYNTDSSNFISGAGIHPEARFQFPVVNLNLRLGAGVEYLWQVLDDTGGAKSDNNTLNSSLTTSTFYAIFNIQF